MAIEAEKCVQEVHLAKLIGSGSEVNGNGENTTEERLPADVLRGMTEFCRVIVTASASLQRYHHDQSVKKPSQCEGVELPSSIEFHDRSAAARSFSRLRVLLPKSALEALLQFLIASPNPDSVLVQFERLAESSPGEIATAFARQPILIHYAALVFGHSVWLGETLIQNVDLLQRFGRDRGLDRSYTREDYREEFARMRSRSTDIDLGLSLALFRKREYVRILLRDVLGIAKLAETTEEISALSDALLEEALREANAHLQRQHGPAQWIDSRGRLRDSRFAVLALGKLGGNELNYSSDIDLMFLYDGGIEPSTASLSNREYFIRSAQRIVEILSHPTREGQVFRIDLRLRPQGHEGELAAALPRAIHYYSQVAEDWELQAMIKARHSAGDDSLAREFIHAVEPFVYRPNVNFAAVKTALQTRENIDKRGKKSAPGRASQRAIDVKLERGGIRDIEFLVQCLQRVYGGDEGWLRSRGTLFALQKLHDKEHISGKDFQSLTTAYEFLRHLEHRLQLRHGQQIHRLPHDESDLKVLAKCLNREGSSLWPSNEFVAQAQCRMATVAEIYRRIVYQEQTHQFIDPDGNLHLQVQVPATVENSYSQIMQRLAVDAPRLLEAISLANLSQHARRGLDRLFSAAATSPERYATILRSPAAVEKALAIFECSDYLTDILVRHPTDVALLEEVKGQTQTDSTALFDVRAEPVKVKSDPVALYLSQDNVERPEALALLRRQFRHSLFSSGARDLFDPRSVFESFKENTRSADGALKSALAIAAPPSGLAVMALGRLGSCEFDLLSDADILFVADEACNREDARRTAERIMDSLMAYTRDGTVFPVDTRLRPQGREGDLVTTPAHLARYFENGAQPWEAISYSRLRLVAGEDTVGERALAAVREGIAAMAQRPNFDNDLWDMRLRLQSIDLARNLKTGPGGTYDVEFLLGRLQAKSGKLEAGTLVKSLDLVRQQNMLGEAEFRRLSQNVEFLRSLEHFVRLVTGRPGKWIPVGEHARVCVEKLMTKLVGYDESRSLDEKLDEAMRQTRAIYLEHRF